MRILLVNPPIYDFSAYDFWLRPYGLLRIAGYLRNRAQFQLFDFLDRSQAQPGLTPHGDQWGRGKFRSEEVEKPAEFSALKRPFRRYGQARDVFRSTLSGLEEFDAAMIQTNMTYWYPGVREVMEDIRMVSPATKVILGGVYATLCPLHAASLGPDLIVIGLDLSPLWNFLELEPDLAELPLWDSYRSLSAGVLKLADGCPFKCTYCSVPQVYQGFKKRSLKHCLREFRWLVSHGTKNLVFYDDALLFRTQQVLEPFLNEVILSEVETTFHTPNALNARFVTPGIADLMVKAGFKLFYLGFESNSTRWQKKTGSKVRSIELKRAVECLAEAGADRQNITAYLIVGHPDHDIQHVEESMAFSHDQGIRIMLSEFSPIPGTPDGEKCRTWVDLEEPLYHNKTAFSHTILGEERIQRLKEQSRCLNASLKS